MAAGRRSNGWGRTLARYAAFIVNGFGAPDLAELTECGAPELEEPCNYLGSFILNNLFAVEYPDPMKRLTLMFGRRADNAVREYRTGRDLLSSYLQRLPQRNDHFLVALRATTHFEQCIGSVCHGSALLERLVEVANARDPSNPNVPDDRERRLRLIWNRSKHFDEDISPGKMVADKITAPVWLTNTGISSEKITVTWRELHGLIKEQQQALKFFSEELPSKVIEMRRLASIG